MRFFVGTSGYSYKEWKGSFYPEKLPQKEMLSYYAQRFSAVEVNNTFYRMPQPGVIESWAKQVPPAFRFVLKAPQTITHFGRLKGVEEQTDQFVGTASVLKKQLGPLLFQLPPNFKKDLPRLECFLKQIKDGTAIAFEFRHESWFEEDVFACLRAKACALCMADSEDTPAARLLTTAPSILLRLRRERYSKKQLV
jgi:uncharacterized protein YecE (DUF72 family)